MIDAHVKPMRLLTLSAVDAPEPNILATSFFVSRETVVPTEGDGMAHWREELFATMSDISSSVVDYFKIPPNRVIELGTRVEI
jgi:KUP system potassium uptake protein